MTALELARFFHDTYERLAPDFGYETRQDTREFSPSSKNGQLMVAVCAEVLTKLNAWSAASQPSPARPLSEWHEDDGPVLWWVLPVTEPPYCGTPIDAEWPHYHTHWTRIEVPRAADNGDAAK